MRRLAVTLLCVSACSRAVYEPRLHAPDVPPRMYSVHNGRLKVHLTSGDLVVLTSWTPSETALSGTGTRYDILRRITSEGRQLLPLDSIALLESEVRTGSRPDATVGMAIWTTIWGVFTGICVADPKSCFGSCPTFYVATDSGEALAAEGFSASIARALEARDLDALFPARAMGGGFTVRMRNEALETHAVRSLTLLAVRRPRGGRVLASSDGTLYPATAVRGPIACRAPEGDCLAALRAQDAVERTSLADSIDLAATETIELTFPAATGRLGLVLAARQSLMSTYLFYETMGFLGSRAGETLAALERGGPEVAGRAMGMARLIGRITVEVLAGNQWTLIGSHDEAGPLATHVEVLPFTTEGPGPVRIRLTASRGAWRLDWVALADLGEPTEAVVVEPEAVLRGDRPDAAALALLRDPGRHLVTYPGDAYDVVFRLPPADGEWELFLQSEGYYYEWMRSEWLADEDPALAALVLTDPAAALRVLAPEYKRGEIKMEQSFWSSRFGR